MALERVYSENVKSILKVFGPKLKKLILVHCGDTVLADLTSCCEVKKLSIYRGWHYSTLIFQQPKHTLDDAKIFVPNLKDFYET